MDASIAYYMARLIVQYVTQPRASNTIAILTKQAIADMFVLQIGPSFDLATAVGAQLDIIGKYVGVPRTVGPATSQPYFSFRRYADTTTPSIGFQRYAGGVNITGIFNRYAYGPQPNTALPDPAYRTLLHLKIIDNMSDGTLGSIYSQIYAIFGSLIEIIDTKNMSVTYNVSNTVPLQTSILQAYLPKPMGVGIVVNRF